MQTRLAQVGGADAHASDDARASEGPDGGRAERRDERQRLAGALEQDNIVGAGVGDELQRARTADSPAQDGCGTETVSRP